MPRLFIYGYYGFGNVGDDLLLKTVITSTLNAVPDSQFVVRSLSPVKVGMPTAHVEFLPLAQITSDQRLSRGRRLGRYLRDTWKSLEGCTHLVFGGGTLFHARANSPVNLALIFILVVMARLRGLDIYALGVGVAPLRAAFASRLMAGILTLATDFAVRDKTSLQQCRTLTRRKSVRATADLVFSLPLQFVSESRRSRPKTVIAITLAASDIGNGVHHDDFLQQLAYSLELLDTKGWTIRFLSFQELEHSGICLSDTELFRRAQSYASNHVGEIVRLSADYIDISEVYSDIAIVAGMRFHGHILAAMQGIPFVGFGRDEKLRDLCADLSMPFHDMATFNAANFATSVEDALEKKPDAQRIQDLVQLSSENFSKFLESIS
jgi:polysaccharide pyruvyl transferase WcaK-like protein